MQRLTETRLLRTLRVLAMTWVTAGSLVSSVFADTLYFKSGNSLTGLVVEEHRDRIVVSTEEGEKTVLRRDIDEVFYSEPERNHLYLGQQALEEGDVHLARGFFEKALQVNPRLQEAEDALHRVEDLERKRELLPAGDWSQTLWEHGGLSLEAGTPYVTISRVKPGSSADKAGLEPGDSLVNYWGESLAFLSPKPVAEALWGPPRTLVKITIQRLVTLPPAPATVNDWPHCKLEMEHLGLTVDRTDPTGAAGLARLMPGDRIVSLNGQATRYLPLVDARRLIQQSKEKGLSLLIHRDLTIQRE